MPPIVAGGLYLVADELLTLLPVEQREKHAERRRFVVVSGSATNSDTKWPVVLGCPVSASTRFRTRFDVKLVAGEAGTTKKCWIRVPAIQPLLKADLEDLTGHLSEQRLQELQARIIEYLGLLEEDDRLPDGEFGDEPF